MLVFFFNDLLFSSGVDPVHDAIAEYNRSRQGIAVPPDVYLGLRFADGQEETSSAQAGKVSLIIRVLLTAMGRIGRERTGAFDLV